MKKIIFFLPLFMVACTMTQKVAYQTNDISVDASIKPIPIYVDLKILEDNRVNIEDNQVLFSSPRQLRLENIMTCINSEKHYKADSVVCQITRLMASHFNAERLFAMTFYNQSNYSDYYISGTLNSFYGQQEYSQAAAVGAQFGLIGALATSGVKTPGRIVIEIVDLKMFKKDGTLVKDFGGMYKEYEDDFKADGYCWMIYANVNEKLKDFNSHLVTKIRNDLEGVTLE